MEEKKTKAEGLTTKPVEVELISEGELKLGYWFVTHKEGLSKIGVYALVVLCILFWGYSFLAVSYYLIFQYSDQQNMLATSTVDYVNYQGIKNLNQILPVEVIARNVIPLGGGKVDIALRVFNPNPQWSLQEFSYEVTVGGNVYDAKTDYLLPNQEKYLFLLNVDGVGTGTPQVFFDNEEWRRVTLYDEWGPARLNIVVENERFLSSRQSELSGQLPVSEVRADIINATPYNYRELILQFVLISGNRIVGVNQIPLHDLDSSQTREVTARWTEQLASVSTIEIIPTVNILDPQVYRDYEGELFP